VAPAIFTAFSTHWYVRPVPVFAFSVTDPPVQRFVLPAGVTMAVGGVPVVTLMPLDVVLPQLFVTIHV
jgi:hypothetical protein